MAERRVFRALAVAVPLLFVACAAVTGLDDFDIIADASTDGGPVSTSPEAGIVVTSPDATSPSGGDDAGDDAGDAGDAGAAPDGGSPPHDAAPDAPICTVPELNSARTFSAVHLASAPVIDGSLDDWPCGFVALDKKSAERVDGIPISNGQIAVGWDDTGVYFACRVFDTDVEGTGTEPYKNDACELFIGTPPPGDGSYVAGDYHFVVDYKNLGRYYPVFSESSGLPAGVTSSALQLADGFVVEMFVPTAVLGFTPNASAMAFFDAQIDDCQNTTPQAGILFAYSESASGLAQCADQALHQPACDTRLWGQVAFEP